MSNTEGRSVSNKNKRYENLLKNPALDYGTFEPKALRIFEPLEKNKS